MPRRPRSSASEDPWSVLGLPTGSPAQAIQRARRDLAKQAHPDVGGSAAAMQRINDAATRALAQLDEGRPDRPGRREPPNRHRPPGGHGAPPGARQDHPSFTVEALPVETYEGLLVVASWLGDVVLDEPPYEIEVTMTEPIRGWCRLDVVPDAGASTVSVSVAAEPGYPVPDLDTVRDLWIDGLNRLDWDDLPEPPRERPLS